MNKNNSILTILSICILLCSCAYNADGSELPMYRYIFEDEYGEINREVVHNRDQFLAHINNFYADEIPSECDEYDENFYQKNDLVMFRFFTSSIEKNLKIEKARRVDQKIFIDFSLDYPLPFGNDPYGWDTDIGFNFLFIEIPKYLGDLNFFKESVGILVKNVHYENIYFSHYYDCRKDMIL